MKKIIVSIFKLMKECGVLLRVVGIILLIILLWFEAIPDLTFGVQSRNLKVFTEEEILKSEREKLPRYLKIKGMVPISGKYVESYSVKKGDTLLESIIYPIYDTKRLLSVDSSIDKEDLTSYIVVKNIKPKEFNSSINNTIIEGKFDNTVIDEESRNLLESEGYKVDKTCILIQTGVERWGIGQSLLIVILAFHGLVLILLSFYSLDKIKKVLNVKS